VLTDELAHRTGGNHVFTRVHYLDSNSRRGRFDRPLALERRLRRNGPASVIV